MQQSVQGFTAIVTVHVPTVKHFSTLGYRFEIMISQLAQACRQELPSSYRRTHKM